MCQRILHAWPSIILCLLPIRFNSNIYNRNCLRWRLLLLLLLLLLFVVVFHSSLSLVTSVFFILLSNGFNSVRHLFLFPIRSSSLKYTHKKVMGHFFVCIVLFQMQNQVECHFQLLSSKAHSYLRHYTHETKTKTNVLYCGLIHFDNVIYIYIGRCHGNNRREWNRKKKSALTMKKKQQQQTNDTDQNLNWRKSGKWKSCSTERTDSKTENKKKRRKRRRERRRKINSTA